MLAQMFRYFLNNQLLVFMYMLMYVGVSKSMFKWFSVEPNQTLSTSISSPSPTPLDEIMINSDQRRIDFLLLRK